MAVTDLPLPARLVKGAAFMGKFWRSGLRCEYGWGQVCTCAPPSDFCRAKIKWVELYEELQVAEAAVVSPGEIRPKIANGTFGIVEAMTSDELEASGLTLTIEVEEVGKVKVGPKGDVSWADFSKCNGETLRTVLEVLKSFPGSRVQNGGASVG